jgi:pyruvate dehydrogenase E2 component (dihydrolipoamide acetyltransferase)
MSEFCMPSLGADMEDGKLVEWLKKPGDSVRSGDIVAVVETQKGAIEIEVFEDGIVEQFLVEPGSTVAVGTPIALIRGLREAPGAKKPAAPVAKKAPATVAEKPAKARSPAPPTVPATGIAASPAARKLAQDKGVELSKVVGSGPDGAILYVDVEGALRKIAPTPVASAPPAEKRAVHGPDLAGMRATIAAATARAKREIPHYYLTHAVDLTVASEWLARTNATHPPKDRILLAAVLIKALALSLRKLPEFNGFCVDGIFQPSDRIHVGVAIAIRGGGLVAPAIHDTDKLALSDVMVQLRDLVGRVRLGRFRSSELSDPTVTFTSLGDRGVDVVIPVIYRPQVAILGAGTPRQRPWVVGEKVEPRFVIDISMAGDHRVGDGHRGALLLAAWADLMQRPEQL